MDLFVQPSGQIRLGDWLNANLRSGDWTTFRAAVAFVKFSGVRHITEALAKFSLSGQVEIIVGIDHYGTSHEGLRELLKAVSPNGRIIVFHNLLSYTFHPKIFMFRTLERAELLVGSGNLTQGGLYTNYEAGLRVLLDLGDTTQHNVLDQIEGVLNAWADENTGTSRLLDRSTLDSLVETSLVPEEKDMVLDPPAYGGTERSGKTPAKYDIKNLFESVTVPNAPSTTPYGNDRIRESSSAIRSFAMTLQMTDIGIGQTTAGTSRRSPEIFVPLKARDAHPEFWGWRADFEEDPDQPGKFDRRGVRIRVRNNIVLVNMMTWPVKHDFRLRSEALRSIGNVGDIIVIEKVNDDSFEYRASVITKDSPQYEYMIKICNQYVPNSKKQFGYF